MAIEFKIFTATDKLRKTAEVAAEQLDGRERVKSSQDEGSATELYKYTWSPQHEEIVNQFLEDHD
ncbi:hypothetical protein VM1G_12001 [Cytospora mali]|uniref:Uncharacterized protein n=1 Tax=Cytospora mali TaxID=578113 RepID=A0A194VHH7_CYTMA|nr:hypothetical protein VM1G_12001 [Valsa mali]